MKKFFSILIMTVLLAVVCTAVIGISAEEPIVADGVIGAGIYNIVNVENGKYLNCFDTRFSSDGYAYVDVRANDEAENILILPIEGGGFLMYPQSESGKYAFCASEENGGSKISKSENVDFKSEFEIVGNGDSHAIFLKGTTLAMEFSTDDKLYKKQLVCISEYTGADSQKWLVVPAEITSFELKTVSEKVSINTVSAVYAVTSPAYMKNFAEWSSSDDSVVLIDDDGSFCALSAGKATITAKINSFVAQIDVEVVEDVACTWYSQHLTTDGGWHAKELENVYFYSGAYKRFIINGYNRGLDWMDEGCAITSTAIILRNLGARFENGYDFRFDAEGNLEADPYTVALANTGNYGLRESRGTLYYNPVMTNLRSVTDAFTLYGKKLTYESKGKVTKDLLKKALETHPEGVMVRMVNAVNGTHYIVISKCINPDAQKSSDYKFMVYDPSGLRRNHGDNVPFEQSISYETMKYRYGNMVTMITFDLAE